MPATPPPRSLRRPRFPHLLIAVLVGATMQPGPEAAAAAEPASCVATLVPAESQDVRCALPPSMTGLPLRFVAQFTGSHDDTRLRLTATLAGQPVACEPGSTTSLVAEDGEVSLDCRFRISREQAVEPVLAVALSVHHAQFLSATLVGE